MSIARPVPARRLGALSAVASLSGLVVFGSYCGDDVAPLVAGVACLAFGPITAGAYVYVSSDEGLLDRVTAALFVIVLGSILLGLLAVGINLSHCPLF